MARVVSDRKSGSLNPGCAAEMTPIAPSLATAPARPDKLIPIPMPPWIIGIEAVSSPMRNFGNFITASIDKQNNKYVLLFKIKMIILFVV